MSWIYALLVWICVLINVFTNADQSDLLLGIEIGILIGQLVHLIIVIYENRSYKKYLKEMKSNDKNTDSF